MPLLLLLLSFFSKMKLIVLFSKHINVYIFCFISQSLSLFLPLHSLTHVFVPDTLTSVCVSRIEHHTRLDLTVSFCTFKRVHIFIHNAYHFLCVNLSWISGFSTKMSHYIQNEDQMFSIVEKCEQNTQYIGIPSIVHRHEASSN